MLGIIPAAGNGTRIQPLAFSKELLPVGSRIDAGGAERPRAVSEYLVERMIGAGADRLCFVISPWKSDILQYYGGGTDAAPIAYVIQDEARGLCDAIFRALPLLRDGESVLVGLPDTIWFPAGAYAALPDERFSFLLFPVDEPKLFDSVTLGEDGRVSRIAVKSPDPVSRWIWGGFKLPAADFRALHALWRARGRRDEYWGTLVEAWMAEGGIAYGVRAGESYVDVGTLHGYREAMRLLGGQAAPATGSLATGSPAIGFKRAGTATLERVP